MHRDFFAAYLMSPPCSTYSVARSKPGGPPPLRGESAPDMYSLPDLMPEQTEQTSLGRLVAPRAAEAASMRRATRAARGGGVLSTATELELRGSHL